MRLLAFSVLFAISVLFPPLGFCAGFTEVSAPEVKQLGELGALIINTLSAMEHELQHIPGSINIPINTLERSTLLPADKDTPLVFYCINER